MIDHQALLTEVEAYVKDFFEKNISEEYHFHDFQHIVNVVQSCKEISESYDLSNEDQLSLELAAWFHDLGYFDGTLGHEQRSADHAINYLKQKGLSEGQLTDINSAIMATKMPQSPTTLLQEILCDADLSHLGKRNYWNRCGRLRFEMAEVQGKILGEVEWLDFEIDFLTGHNYFTRIATALYDKRKSKNLRRLLKQKSRVLKTDNTIDSDDLSEGGDPNVTDPLREQNVGRGVETMYRNAYRTHISLSQIADNKANIMLSVNAIILSIVVTSLVPRLLTERVFILPTISLLITCLLAIIYATLSTKPQVTEGIVKKSDIIGRKSNLLFFGNFYKMPIDDFHWGMMEMIKDLDFLYSSMTRDLYFLGKVLAKKYRYLSLCYSIFMIGLIVSVVLFAVSFYFVE